MNSKLLRSNFTEKIIRINQKILEKTSLFLQNASLLKLVEEKQISAKKGYSGSGRIF